MCLNCNQFISPENSIRLDSTQLDLMNSPMSRRMADVRLLEVDSFSLTYESQPMGLGCCVHCTVALRRVVDICYADLTDMDN